MPNPIFFFVLVVGHDYDGKKLSFAEMCTNRVKERIAKARKDIKGKAKKPLVAAPATLRFVRFDVTDGGVQFFDYDLKVRTGGDGAFSARKWQPITAVPAAPAASNLSWVRNTIIAVDPTRDYQPGSETFDPNNPPDSNNVTSIVDVYDAIRSAPAKSVMELSFFSHGWVEGPILVNSTRDPATPVGQRDPNDHDGRSATDFTATMGAAAGATRLTEFKNAFADGAKIQTWGCNFDIEVRVVQQVLKAMKRDKTKKLEATSSFDLEFELPATSGTGTARYWTDRAFFGPDTTPPTQTFTKTGDLIKNYLTRRIQNCYAFQAAVGTGLTTLGAVPGTGGDDEKSQNHGGIFLMQVCRNADPKAKTPECPDGWGPILDFYKKHFGIKNDAKRGYGIYDPATVTAINLLPSSP